MIWDIKFEDACITHQADLLNLGKILPAKVKRGQASGQSYLYVLHDIFLNDNC